MNAADLIRLLDLKPHPEGGFYAETYRAAERVEQAALPARYGGGRAFSTAIYFLLTADTFSALHRLKSDADEKKSIRSLSPAFRGIL